MEKIGEKPMMHYVIENFINQGFDDIVITLHYMPNVITDYFGDGSHFGAKITYAYEEKLMGTAGSIKKMERYLSDDFFVCSGSYLPETLDLNEIVKCHRENKALGTVVLASCVDQKQLSNFGQAVINAEKQIVRFEEKPKSNFSDLVHTTYQIYSPSVFSYIPENVYYTLPDDVIPQILQSKNTYGYVYNGRLFGISTVEAYNETKQLLCPDL